MKKLLLTALISAIFTTGGAQSARAEAQAQSNIFSEACELLLLVGRKATTQFQYVAETFDDSVDSLEMQFAHFLKERSIALTDIRGIEYIGNINNSSFYYYEFVVTHATRPPFKVYLENANFERGQFVTRDKRQPAQPLADVESALDHASQQAADGESNQVLASQIKKALTNLLAFEGFEYSAIAAVKYISTIEADPALYVFELRLTDHRSFTLTVPPAPLAVL
jgi:hypothetical protein